MPNCTQTAVRPFAAGGRHGHGNDQHEPQPQPQPKLPRLLRELDATSGPGPRSHGEVRGGASGEAIGQAEERENHGKWGCCFDSVSSAHA